MVTGTLMLARLPVWCQQFSAPRQAIYTASMPCSAGTKPLPGLPATAACELINGNWYYRAKTGAATYSLDCYLSPPQTRQQGFYQGGTRLQRSGKWIEPPRDTGNPAAMICQLDPRHGAVNIFLSPKP